MRCYLWRECCVEEALAAGSACSSIDSSSFGLIIITRTRQTDACAGGHYSLILSNGNISTKCTLSDWSLSYTAWWFSGLYNSCFSHSVHVISHKLPKSILCTSMNEKKKNLSAKRSKILPKHFSLLPGQNRLYCNPEPLEPCVLLYIPYRNKTDCVHWKARPRFQFSSDFDSSYEQRFDMAM